MTARKKRWWRILIRLTVLPVLLWLMLRWFEHANVFQPSRSLWVRADVLGRPFEEVELDPGDGVRLHGWFFPADAASPRRHLALLHCHGNGGNMSHRVDIADALLETGVNVLLFDYRGYGQSTGRPSEAGTYRDARAAHAWLVKRGFAATNIIAFGESLGGGVVSELALREPLGGLILQSTFTSIPDIGAELFPWLPVRWLARIRYDTRARLPQIHVPVLVMHGPGDTLIPFAHGERNFAAANPPKQFAGLAGDHNDFLDAGRPQFIAGVEAFLTTLAPASPGASPPAAPPP